MSLPPHPTAAGAGLRPAAGDRRARGAARAQPARPRQRRGALAGAQPGRGRRRHARPGSSTTPPSCGGSSGRSRRSARGRVVITDAEGVLVADSDGAGQLGASYATRPEIAAALRGPTASRTSATRTRSTRRSSPPPCRSSARGQPEGAVRITQSVEAVTRATRTSILGLVAVGGLVLLLGLGAGALIAAPDRPPAAPPRRRRRPPRPTATSPIRVPVEGSAEQQGARAHVQRDGRRGSSGSSPASRSSSPTPRTSSARRSPGSSCGSRRRARPATRRRSTAALAEVDRLSAMVSELLLLSQAGEVDAPAEEIDLGAAARAAAARFDGRVKALAGAPTPPVTPPPPTSSARSTR